MADSTNSNMNDTEEKNDSISQLDNQDVVSNDEHDINSDNLSSNLFENSNMNDTEEKNDSIPQLDNQDVVSNDEYDTNTDNHESRIESLVEGVKDFPGYNESNYIGMGYNKNGEEVTESSSPTNNPPNNPSKDSPWYDNPAILGGITASIFLLLISLIVFLRVQEAKKSKKIKSQKRLKKEENIGSFQQSGMQIEIERLRGKVRELGLKNDELSSKLIKKDKEINDLTIKCSDIKKESQIQKDKIKTELAESKEMLAKTKQSLWPATLQQSQELKPLLENVEKEYLDKKNEAQELHAALSTIAIKDPSDVKGIVREIVPLSQAFYKWLENVSISNKYDELLSSWLTKLLSQQGIIVKSVNIGDSYSDSYHSCSMPNGLSITKVYSFLILSSDNKVMKKAQVDVGA